VLVAWLLHLAVHGFIKLAKCSVIDSGGADPPPYFDTIKKMGVFDERSEMEFLLNILRRFTA
jgi:hypothetical protein